MISRTLYLSSNPSSATVFLSSVVFSDTTNAVISLSGIDRSRIPVSLRFRWGDNSSDEFYTNNFFINYTELSIIDQIQNNINYTLLKDYEHIFYPSSTSNVVNLTCQSLLTYHDGTSCRFIQPISIYSPSYYQRIGDLKLSNINYIDTDRSMLFTFTTSQGEVVDFVFDSETE
jgi:hypothetical protein